MSEMPQTAGERHIEKIMQEIDPASERYQVLDSARRFKSSWIDLGDQLLRVNSRNLFLEWGYQNFEDYCTKEIRIKKATAEKMTLAYRFMERQEPELLQQRSELKPLPDYRCVDLLRQAKDERQFSDEEYAALRKSVVEEERSHPTVRKLFKETSTARGDLPTDPLLPLKVSLSAARRLDTALREVENIPMEYREQVETLISCLENELAALAGTEDPA